LAINDALHGLLNIPRMLWQKAIHVGDFEQFYMILNKIKAPTRGL
jgi:hypothetical protein